LSLQNFAILVQFDILGYSSNHIWIRYLSSSYSMDSDLDLHLDDVPIQHQKETSQQWKKSWQTTLRDSSVKEPATNYWNILSYLFFISLAVLSCFESLSQHPSDIKSSSIHEIPFTAISVQVIAAYMASILVLSFNILNLA
jgi:hypothetical protein